MRIRSPRTLSLTTALFLLTAMPLLAADPITELVSLSSEDLAGIHGTHHARAAEQVDLLQEIAGHRDDVINRGMVSFGGAGYLLVEGSFHVAGIRTEQCVKLWKTNGAAGSAVIKSLCDTDGNLGYTTYPIPKRTWDISRSPNPANEPVVLGDSFFFVVVEIDTEYDYKTYLWKSDGTAEGTVKVREIPANDDFRNAICVMGDTLYYLAGGSLWRSDGTGPGTWTVLDLSYPQSPYTLLAYNDRLYIYIQNAKGKGEILVSNGRTGGTRVFLTDIGRFDPQMIVHDNALYFLADDHVHGKELWKTDGTYPGTHLVADINPGPGGSDITNLISLNGRLLLFWANDFVFGRELWRTDGTREGTTRVKDIAPGPHGTNNFLLLNAAMNDELYFNIQIGTGTVHQLWKTNGQEGGTVLIRDNLYSPSQGFNASDTIVPADSAILGNKLYFRAAATPLVNGYWNTELWTTDGTAQGTYQVKDIAPGNDPDYDHALSSWPSNFITIDDTVVFRADYDYSANVPPDEYLARKVGIFGVRQVKTGFHAPALPGIIRLLLSGN